MPGADVLLHGFFRSSASWRVRIALALKGIAFEQQSYKLREGEHRAPDYLGLNPQGLVPVLEIDGLVLSQSLAICEYLDETRPEPPLVFGGPAERQQIRRLAQIIACDTHPVQNLKVLHAVSELAGGDAANAWARDVNAGGLAAFASVLATMPETRFCAGDQPSLADVCLIPQMANARRFGVDLKWPRLEAVEANCMQLPAFHETAPEHQPDFVG